MAWLSEELAVDQQEGPRLAPGCLKDVVEELFARRRDLFSTRDLVFMDMASLYFEGDGGRTPGRRGFSKDYRAGPPPNDPGGAARQRRPPGMHGDVSREHRRHGQRDPGGRWLHKRIGSASLECGWSH